MADLLRRLRERKLVQWSLAYIAAAFALIQVLDVVAQRFGWPEVVERGFIVALAIGFFVALLLAWYHGERGAQRVSGTELMILALLLLIGAGILWRVAPGPQVGDAASMRVESRAATAAKDTDIPAKSVAVLPFENLSDDKANAYFAGGMRDEILTRLAGVGALKVISRSSTEHYASRPEDLKTVGRQLGVATVLEGSVQRAGDTVHINLQLIDARSDGHLWAESYDRDLKDIFAVERDIAQKVAEALKAKLLPEEVERVGAVATRNPEAHDLYLRGRFYFNRASDQFVLIATEMPQAIALFEQARAKDPGFALAAADLASAHMNMYWLGPDRSASRLAAAKTAVDQALAIQPELAAAHIALGQYYYWGFRDYAQALQHFETVRRLQPNDAEAVIDIAAIARRQARWPEALRGLREAASLNPRASLPPFVLGETYLQLRHYAEAEQALRRSIELANDTAAARVRRAEVLLLWQGDLGALRAALDGLAPGSDAYTGNAIWRYRLQVWSRDFAAAARVAESSSLDNWPETGNVTLPRRLFLAHALAATGETARANALFAELRKDVEAELKNALQSPDLHLALGFVLADLGLKDEALAEGRRAVSLTPVSLDAFSGPVYLAKFAQIAARVGANDEAIDTLRKLLTMPAGHAVTPALLELDPSWDGLRRDPRFQQLIDTSQAPVAIDAAS